MDERKGATVRTLVKEGVGQLHFFEQLLRRIFIDVVLVAWKRDKLVISSSSPVMGDLK
jgi:hypothetical protein